jgi:hypothetical protein
MGNKTEFRINSSDTDAQAVETITGSTPVRNGLLPLNYNPFLPLFED